MLAKDANNNAMPGVAVTLAASAGTLTLGTGGSTTGTAGTITATLSGANVAAGTTITVTATAGTATGKATVNVVATQQTLVLQTTSPQMPSNNSAPVTVTAIVLGANNQLLSGVPVSFSASSGAIKPIQTTAGATANVPAGTTDANGQAQATVSTAGDPTNRTITVTAGLANGSTTATVTVTVIGTSLAVTGPTSMILANAGTFTVALTDSAGAGIGGKTVSLASALNNPLSVSSVTTDNTGHATFTVTGNNAGSDTISATALGLTAKAALTVSNETFSLTTTPSTSTTITLNTPQLVTVTWTNSKGPVANTALTLATDRGGLAATNTTAGATGTLSLTTNTNGVATAYVSATTAGIANITASATDTSTTPATNVAAELTVEFVATIPNRMTLQPSPATISTGGQSTITAVVWDAQNNLVYNQQVFFTLTDPTGGSLASPGYAYTDFQGVAQIVYTASSTPSAANGVVISATVGTTSVTKTTSLTVGGQALSLTFNQGTKIAEQNTNTQFVLPYTFTVVDATGKGVPNATVSLTIHSFPYVDVPTSFLNVPTLGNTYGIYGAYAKGSWFPVGQVDPNNTNAAPNNTFCSETLGGIAGTAYCQVIRAYCYNEDIDGSGILQNTAEDVNGNGKLDPGDVATVTWSGSGPLTTDSTGNAVFSVVYPEDHAGWVQVLLTGTTSVAGTEYAKTTAFFLPMLATYIDTGAVGTPPGYLSPYGSASACSNPQ